MSKADSSADHSGIIEDLQWRGLIAQSTDIGALRKQLETPTALYAGFDPTGESLHAGHLVPLLMLRRFQLAGHRPFALAGGATGMIGDPRDVGERSMLSDEQVQRNLERIRGQLATFIDLEPATGEGGSNGDRTDAAIGVRETTGTGARLVNNADWTGKMSVIDFLRDLGKNFSLNTMLSRDTVKRRLAGDGISYTEFSYMLLQANDYVHLRRNYDVRLQIGGSDQWGNIISGVDLNRRLDGESVHALTVPLVTDSEGNKFGKSTGGGRLWLDPELTSPYTWYQYFFNTADADVLRYLKWFTFLSREDIERLAEEVEHRPFKREAQRTLAREMTTLVHGKSAVEQAELAAQALFGKAELTALDRNTLKAALGEAGLGVVEANATAVDLLVAAGLEPSKGAARRTIGEGGAYANNERIGEIDWVPGPDDLLFGEFLVLRKGKKRFAGVQVRAD
ncbi:tyrosine--tRNA ligase [Corynebacterium heidelbergense]|uniref:Tyrosine--tRNA ligase n=1 Tax=Corynebacterium heidelbergense TaxID=2055947 RepID=A0A364V6V8_9CORY|nr:tyrosine--tRNA ligase [Corynebacterium heidelbergense]RAV32344.1 tyrosine--tRNA ligase [Corynebacterium heidelbergense]